VVGAARQACAPYQAAWTGVHAALRDLARASLAGGPDDRAPTPHVNIRLDDTRQRDAFRIGLAGDARRQDDGSVLDHPEIGHHLVRKTSGTDELLFLMLPTLSAAKACFDAIPMHRSEAMTLSRHDTPDPETARADLTGDAARYHLIQQI
jgi:hypothetical protein